MVMIYFLNNVKIASQNRRDRAERDFSLAAINRKANIMKRHSKPGSGSAQGGIVEKEAPIHISNLMLICNKCAEQTRISKRTLEDGSRVRVCKKCGDILSE